MVSPQRRTTANTSPPMISGTAQVGQTLIATNGTWSNAPASFAYEWLRCNGGGLLRQRRERTQQTYTLVAADAGSTMRVRVTATNADGSSSAQSAQTAMVAAATRMLHRRTQPHRRSPVPRKSDRHSRRTREAGRGTRPATPSNGSGAMQTWPPAPTRSARPQERILFESLTWATACACASPPGTTRAARPPTRHARRSWRQPRRSQTSAQP